MRRQNLDNTEMTVEGFGRTDVGRARDRNEDSLLIADMASQMWKQQPPRAAKFDLSEEGGLFVVADGMGGGTGGDVASQMAVLEVYDQMRAHIKKQKDSEPRDPAVWLGSSIAHTNQLVYRASRRKIELNGMGTTVTAAYIVDTNCYIGHVGDSRAYAFRNSKLKQLTKDQSLVAKLVEEGSITASEASHHPARNIILQAVGGKNSVQVDLLRLELRHGDYLLLCTDGLYVCVSDEEIAGILASGRKLEKVCDMLVDVSN